MGNGKKEKQMTEFNYTDERFADIQMLRYRLKGFEALTLRQKKYIYCLSKAALCGRDITFDQFGSHNLATRKTLEALLFGEGRDASADPDSEVQKAFEYLKRVWFANGIYHHYSTEKFVPEFSEQWFRAETARLGDQFAQSIGYSGSEALLTDLCPVIFDPTVLPKRVNLADGEDVVATSAGNFYKDVTQAEAERYYADKRRQGAGAKAGTEEQDCQPSWGLNSRLVKRNGHIEEETYTTTGLYAKAIRHIVEWLNKAKEWAENEEQRHIITLLTSYYETGDLRTFDDYSIAWLQENDGAVDFINGFIEVYGDPLGLKGSWEALVDYRDEEASRRTRTLAANAQWFEDHSPIDPRFRKPIVRGVSAKVICAAMLGGDEYPASAIGINLPNAEWIRARYGSKSVTIGNLTEAYNQAAQGSGLYQEFVIDQPTRRVIERYGDLTDDLHTDLHECLGHGSGQLLHGVSQDALKAYGSTMEEARADLFALYYLADPKLVELGLTPDGEAYKAQYYTYMMNGALTQLARIKPGGQIEEAHMRNRAMIARWCLAHGEGVVRLTKSAGKTYVQIDNYEALRRLFAQLLATVQRVKSEGDYETARQLVERYGVTVDAELHEEILARYQKLNIAPYKGFINPRMQPITGTDGIITDIKLDYTETFSAQMLRYSHEYSFL